MKRILLLCCCMFIAPASSMAQMGFRGPVNSGNREALPASEPAVSAAPIITVPVTIPAGTHVLMMLSSSVHTTSATENSEVYLETMVPVFANDHEAIPQHTDVLGTVLSERRPGRVHGKARMSLRFDEIILPDHHQYPIKGSLQSLPGSERYRTTGPDHAIEPVDQIDADVYTVAGATGVGVLAGSLSHVGIGVPQGALIGGGLGLAKVLFSRGNEISLPTGTEVEMVLQQPVTIQARLTKNMLGSLAHQSAGK